MLTIYIHTLNLLTVSLNRPINYMIFPLNLTMSRKIPNECPKKLNKTHEHLRDITYNPDINLNDKSNVNRIGSYKWGLGCSGCSYLRNIDRIMLGRTAFTLLHKYIV